MPISSPVRARWLLLGLLLPLAAVAQPMGTPDGGQLLAPDFVAAAPPGFMATSLRFDIDCKGVRSVEHVPDGWRFEARPEGESVGVEVSLPGAEAWFAAADEFARAGGNLALAKVAVGLVHRGDYSDCYGARVTVQGLVGTGQGTPAPVLLRFAEDESRPGHWKAIGAGRP